MKFPYKVYPDNSIAGVLNVQIARAEKNAPRSKRIEAIIDSGASCCIFHAAVARAVGIDIERGEIQETMGISGKPNRLYMHEIMLYLPGGPIKTKAGFSDELPVIGLLGMRGLL